MTYAELLTRVGDKDALEERAAIIQYESGGPVMDRAGAEAEAVRQWLEVHPEMKPRKQARMFTRKES